MALFSLFYSTSWYVFLFALYSNNGHTWYHFQDKAVYGSNISIFIPLHSMPSLGVTGYHTVCCGKAKMVWLPGGEKV